MSGPAITKHLKVLERDGLIARGREAQWRPCRLKVEPMKGAVDWLGQYRRFWEESFDRRDDFLQELRAKDKKSRRKKKQKNTNLTKSMQSETELPATSKKMLWAGRIMSALPVLMLLFSGVMKLMKPPMVVEGFVHLGWPASLALCIGILELACVIIYLIPQTAVLGAILLTGYLGGAIATHVRIGEQFVGPLIFGVLVWGGLFLRDPRVRALIPLRR